MSADNYLLVRPNGDKWEVVYGVASNDYQKVESTHDTKLEAIEAAQKEDYTEYGIKISDINP